MSSAEALVPAQAEPLGERPQLHAIWTPAFRLALVAQAERVVGLGVAFSSRWFLGPADIGVYSGIRLLLDNTNRSSLGVALGAIQKSIALRARGQTAEADHVLAVANSTNTFTSSIYGGILLVWGVYELCLLGDPRWGVGLVLAGVLAVVKRRQDFRIATLRALSEFSTVGRIALAQNLAFGLCATAGIVAFGYWGLIASLVVAFLVQGSLLDRSGRSPDFPVVWDWRESIRLAAIGMPILAANSAWAFVTTVDRALLLAHWPDGAKLAGYYSLAVLGCGVLEDFASRIAIVLAPAFRTEFGRGGSFESLLERAERTGLILVCLLAPVGFLLSVFGSKLLATVFPGLASGAAALGPLIPGTIALCVGMPLREAWISADRPWIVACIAAVGGLVVAFRVWALGTDGSISAVAHAASLGRIGTVLALFGLTAILVPWSVSRLLRWSVVAFWGGYWFVLSGLRYPGRPGLNIDMRSLLMLMAGLVIAAAVRFVVFGQSRPEDLESPGVGESS